MAAQQASVAPHKPGRGLSALARPADSFGMLLLLILLDYVAMSAVTGDSWGRVVLVVLLGATLLFALRTSRARRIWQLLALLYLIASTLVTLISIFLPNSRDFSQQISIVGGLLLLITPFAIVRRISAHKVVTNETVLGAVSVYLLLGFSFSFIYAAIDFVSPIPFFVGEPHATTNMYLFFSYSTLTTVGYGNLVPTGNVGQTFAMLEALFGQIYLVIIVARLVSLWGQGVPARQPRHASGSASDDPTADNAAQGDRQGDRQSAAPAEAPADMNAQTDGR